MTKEGISSFAKMQVMKITAEIIRHIAKLARINLSEPEVTKFTEQMGAIVSFAEQLDKVDTSGVAETNQVNGMQNVLREDEVEKFERLLSTHELDGINE